MRQITDKELLDYLDGLLSPEDSTEIEEVLKKDGELKERYLHLQRVDKALEAVNTEEAAFDFSDKVMANLHDPRYHKVSLLSIFNQKNLMMVGGILVGIMIGIYIISTGLAPSVLESVSLDSITIQDQSLNLKPIWDSLTGGMFIKIFFLFDLLLALFLLDRAVLKPMFRRRTQAYSL